MSKVLVYAPNERLKPAQALAHPYFNELRAPGFRNSMEYVPDLFDFTKGN
jgi:glycogen synthase kinase 3 beta